MTTTKHVPGDTSVWVFVLGDMVIFATDGIAPDFADDLRLDGPVGEIAERIISRYGKKTDDALVLVTRYVGA